MVFVAVAAISSCSKSSSKETAINTAGTWQGTVVNTNEGSSFSATFTLKQSGTNITGELSTAAGVGNISGSISSNSVTLIFTPAASSGYTEVDTFKGVVNAADNEISGTFTSTEAGESGTFDIKKQ